MDKKLTVIAFGHESRTGKDTAAKFLDTFLRMKGLKVKKVSFAAKLKDISFQVYGWAGLKPGIFYESDDGAKLRDVKLSIGLTPVEIWIEVGNKFREIYEDTWVDNALRTVSPEIAVLIITDLRFPNEVVKVREFGGECHKTDRPGQPKRNSVSDRALDEYTGWDSILLNDKGLVEFHALVEALGNRIVDGR